MEKNFRNSGKRRGQRTARNEEGIFAYLIDKKRNNASPK